jgi:hypothetical protein
MPDYGPFGKKYVAGCVQDTVLRESVAAFDDIFMQFMFLYEFVRLSLSKT